MNSENIKAGLVFSMFLGVSLYGWRSSESVKETKSIDNNTPQVRPYRDLLQRRSFRPIDPIQNNAIQIAFRLIKKYEGFRSTPYLCPAGVLTIGYGETDPDITSREYISEEEAADLLLFRVEKAAKEVERKIYPELTNNQKAALISFYYNCGSSNFDNICRRINKGLIDEASEAITLYTKANGKELEGLKIRRQEEYRLFNL